MRGRAPRIHQDVETYVGTKIEMSRLNPAQGVKNLYKQCIANGGKWTGPMRKVFLGDIASVYTPHRLPDGSPDFNPAPTTERGRRRGKHSSLKGGGAQ